MMKGELVANKLSQFNQEIDMIGNNSLLSKNCDNDEEDDGDSVSSKLDMHYSKDDVVEEDDEFDDFNISKSTNQCLTYKSKNDGDKFYPASEDVNKRKASNISEEIRGINNCTGSGDMIYSLLSILGTHNKDDMSKTLYAMSTSPESCVAMRQSGCLPLLIHLLHNSENDPNYFNVRTRSAIALRNIVNVHCEDQRGRQESRVLRLLEQLRDYCDHLRTSMFYNNCSSDDHYFQGLLVDVQHPVGAVTALMKLTFDEEHRHAVCTLGGIQALADMLQLQQEAFGHSLDSDHVTMRRYTCMALTNLTFGDGTNKALLCSMPGPLRSLVLQLQSINEDLCQVAASVLRNLSWHADAASKRNLRTAGAVQMLAQTMLSVKKEPTLKSLLSALWNFSAHCLENKEDICSIQGALQLLVWSLSFKSPTKTLAVVENGGGVLRNVSSHVAVRPDYRVVLRKHGCLPTLLKHLRSPSLTVVSNACGTLWNLSAHCLEDQKILCSLGAVEMLKNLVHSKHRMISMGSAAALKNLLSSSAFVSVNGILPNPYSSLTSSWLGRNDGNFSCNSVDRPGLHVRRQRALQRELQSRCLSETCDNISSPVVSPVASPHSFDVPQPFSRSLHNNIAHKVSVNFTPLKPPTYPINFSDVICHSDTDALSKSKISTNKSNKYDNHIANMSLEHERIDDLFGYEDNFYSAGMFLSCHETIATGGQDTAADFLPCNIQTRDNVKEADEEVEWPPTFYADDLNDPITHPSFFRDLAVTENVPAIQDLEEEMIRVTVNNDGEIVDLGQLVSGENHGMGIIPLFQNQMHLPNELLSNPHMFAMQKIQNNLLNQPIAFDDLQNSDQLFSLDPPTMIDFQRDPLLFQSTPQSESSPWQLNLCTNKIQPDESHLTPKNSSVNNNNQNSPRKVTRSFLKQPTNYNLSKKSISTAVKKPKKENVLQEKYMHFNDEQVNLNSTSQPKMHRPDENDFPTEAPRETPSESPAVSFRDDSKSLQLSLEHELALQENANLVLSVLERTSLTESNLSSEVHLLEHETISLISDTEVQDEGALFLDDESNFTEQSTGHPDTEKTVITVIEQTTSNVNSEDEVPSITYDAEIEKPRARIVKPGPIIKRPDPFEEKDQSIEPKGIRGRRKGLYSGKPKSAVVPADKRIISSSPSRNVSSQLQKDDKRTKTTPLSGNIFSKNQTQVKGTTNFIKEKITKGKEEKKVAKPLMTIVRPQSAFIRNPGATPTNTEEIIKQAKIKSQSLPPGQKPPTSKDMNHQKSKPKILSKQDTFIKLSKPNVNTSNDNLQKVGQKPAMTARQVIKSKPKKILSRGQVSTTSTEPSTSSNEKVTSVGSSSSFAKQSSHSNISKSGSANSISSSRCSTSTSRVFAKQNSAMKHCPKRPATAEEMHTKPSSLASDGRRPISTDKQESLTNRLQKSSTYDKLKGFFEEEAEEISENTTFNFQRKSDKIESDSLEKVSRETSVASEAKIVSETALKHGRTSKIPGGISSKKQPAENKMSPSKRDISNQGRFSNNSDSSSNSKMKESYSDKKKLNEVETKKENSKNEFILDSVPTKNKFASRLRSDPETHSKSLQKEISAMNAKNLSKTLPLETSAQLKKKESDDQQKNKARPHRGFSFWKKHGTKGKESQDQTKVQSPTASSIPTGKKTTNKSKISPKAESPIRKRVLGWFRKGSDTHALIAEKNQSLLNKDEIPSDFNFNGALISPDIMGIGVGSSNIETPISLLDARNGNNVPIRAAVVQPFNYHNLDSVPDSFNVYSSPKLTKTELLLARHRRSRLASDSRSSMAMSIDSLKVNSVDSFHHTDRSFSDVPSEITEKDDLSMTLSENEPIVISS